MRILVLQMQRVTLLLLGFMASCEGKATNVLKYWITLKAHDHRV